MNAPIRIKSFRAKNLTEALRMVRTELGPDATILETKAAPRSKLGWSRFGVEVTASCGGQHSEEATPMVENQPSSDHLQNDALPSDYLPNNATSDHLDEPSDDRTNLTSVPVHWRKESHSYPDVYMQVASQLLLKDVPTTFIERWLRQSFEQYGSNVQDTWLLRAHIARHIRNDIPVDTPSSSWMVRKEVVAVIGPSGHGKSSAVAKLAAVASMQLGLKPLVLSCETEFVPSNPQLTDYCGLMGWGYEQIDAPKFERKEVVSANDCNWVVIEVPSVAMGDQEGMQRMQAWLTQLGVTQVHLTLAATTGEIHARRMLDWYQALNPSHLLLTKLDESLGLGSLIPCLTAAHLPLGFASVGPRVPSDFLECDGLRLAHWILGSEAV
jgi:flagellar biosynthesis protein FlhF